MRAGIVTNQESKRYAKNLRRTGIKFYYNPGRCNNAKTIFSWCFPLNEILRHLSILCSQRVFYHKRIDNGKLLINVPLSLLLKNTDL